ncbi:hypothetical protein H4582DRAFT_2127178 [Lactarius indigo]|nr:hypothetical protein H4582DRAFT_2127178 [Lactarius indigo]
MTLQPRLKPALQIRQRNILRTLEKASRVMSLARRFVTVTAELTHASIRQESLQLQKGAGRGRSAAHHEIEERHVSHDSRQECTPHDKARKEAGREAPWPPNEGERWERNERARGRRRASKQEGGFWVGKWWGGRGDAGRRWRQRGVGQTAGKGSILHDGGKMSGRRDVIPAFAPGLPILGCSRGREHRVAVPHMRGPVRHGEVARATGPGKGTRGSRKGERRCRRGKRRRRFPSNTTARSAREKWEEHWQGRWRQGGRDCGDSTRWRGGGKRGMEKAGTGKRRDEGGRTGEEVRVRASKRRDKAKQAESKQDEDSEETATRERQRAICLPTGGGMSK